ncbi:MAG: hypothetical protein NT090_17880 [Acidobacteria bacterium]|nr:hypothetical protein [Acidobacteriota bacterium]
MSALQSGYAMLVARLAPVIALAASFVAAQPLVNLGKPLRAPFACTEEDIQSLGLDCTSEEPCAVFLELAALEIAGSKVFLAGNLHTATMTLASILLASEDEGKTWTEPHPRIRSAGLDQIQFFDFERGWVAGQQFEAMPRDPFFLITTDGGKTWRRRPVFGDSQVGSIEQFWFDSRTDGVVLIDRMQSTETGARYLVYETMTGGDTWMVREVSARPLKLKRAPAQNPDRRIRADAKTRSFIVERRQGERWQPLASFLIEAGSCRPAARPAAEPPKPDEAPVPLAPPTPPTPKKTGGRSTHSPFI